MKKEVKKEVKNVAEEAKTKVNEETTQAPEVEEEVLQTPYGPEGEPDPSADDVSEDKVQPREAHWVTERSGFTQKSHCSNCGAAAMAIRGSNDETLTPFCPMCGYIMK